MPILPFFLYYQLVLSVFLEIAVIAIGALFPKILFLRYGEDLHTYYNVFGCYEK